MSNFKIPSLLVSAQWLNENLAQPNLIILDSTLQPVISAATQNNTIFHIPKTQIFDFDKKVCDQSSSLPHMMPTSEHFEKEVRVLGVNNDSVIVVYDRIGTYSSPRACWMFKAMGRDQVAVLNGGLPAWLEAKFITEPISTQKPHIGNFKAKPCQELFCNADDVAVALESKHFAVLDARSEARSYGREPEPRKGLRSGHMPNSINLSFSVVQENGKMRSLEELSKILSSRVHKNQKLIFSCGSGVTACIIALAAELAGYSEDSVYDGSWSEWGLSSFRPVVVGTRDGSVS